MYIIRWLMKHPVILLACYFLAIVAILFSMTGGSSNKESVMDATTEITEKSAEDKLPDAPAVEPSTLTSALVDGKTSEQATTTENKSKAIEGEVQLNDANSEELLLMAREAYWNNGLDESAEIYQQLITLNPEVVDYKGELGNVYWRQGLPKKAAELYAEIAGPMIEEGSAERVANMVGFIGLYFPEKATEIHNKLQASK